MDDRDYYWPKRSSRNTNATPYPSMSHATETEDIIQHEDVLNAIHPKPIGVKPVDRRADGRGYIDVQSHVAEGSLDDPVDAATVSGSSVEEQSEDEECLDVAPYESEQEDAGSKHLDKPFDDEKVLVSAPYGIQDGEEICGGDWEVEDEDWELAHGGDRFMRRCIMLG